MLTYNDLLKCVYDDDRINFVKAVISEHERSEEFKTGTKAGEFYRHIDKELESIMKVVYDREGNKYENANAPNHKLASNLYHFFITQLVSYQLGNGVIFDDEKIKDALGGADFDFRLQEVLTYAANDGEGYGFVSDEGVIPLCLACKVNGNEPLAHVLRDEDDGEIKAAVRYWRLADDKPLRATLYELDGFTEYKEIDGELQVFEEKKPYFSKAVRNDIEGVTAVTSKNYEHFPIVSMGFINHRSSIAGNVSLLFAYDVILSGMANEVDTNTVYWVIKNADGMSKRDDLNFVADMIHDKVLHLPEEVEVSKEEVISRVEPYASVLAVIRAVLFENFQAVDVQNIQSGNKTTVEIRSAYQNLNLKCDEIEKYISDFIRGCLRVKGLDENATFHFKRPNDINQTEMLTSIMGIAQLIGEDTALKLICETLGMIDEYEDIKAKKEEAAMQQMKLAQAMGLGAGE